ncbi:MAG: amidohydrolase family protein [Candidatus Tectomicrobia bacterium]|nr:amidohydrolase family protein [Candidatus Tectomicrobia bacterium]
MAKKAQAKKAGGGGNPPTWDTIMPLPSNPKTGETANDYYILDCEVHVMPENYRRFIKYFPGTKTFEYAHKMCNWWQWVDHRTGKQAAIHPGMDWHIDKIIGDMDRSGVDQITLMRESFIDTTGDSAPFSTNQHVIDAIEKHPDRVIGISNVGPFSKRKTKDVLWELEYLHDNYNFKFTKFYQPEDCAMNDRRLWPVYEMCQAKGIVCYFHTGITIRMGPTRYTQPILLDDVASDFPDLKIVAYHGGYPYWEDLVTPSSCPGSCGRPTASPTWWAPPFRSRATTASSGGATGPRPIPTRPSRPSSSSRSTRSSRRSGATPPSPPSSRPSSWA